jgi:hypothetical protein
MVTVDTVITVKVIFDRPDIWVKRPPLA